MDLLFLADVLKELEKLNTYSDDEILFCKAIRTGRTEILICRSKKQWETMQIEEENLDKIARIVRGRLIKEKCAKDTLVCQEVKFDDCDHSKEGQERQMKELISKARIPPVTSVEVIVSNKLVCFEKNHTDSNKRELECRIVQVKEVIGYNEPIVPKEPERHLPTYEP